jgi:hypothetical protein
MAFIKCVARSCADQSITRSVAIFVLLMLVAAPAAARQIVVGTGTADSCTEAALQLALVIASEEKGGVIRFDCGEDPATISIARLQPGEARAARLVVPDHTTIDGDGLITIDGGRQDGFIMLVPEGAAAELRGLTVRGGAVTTFSIVNFGTLEVDRCTLTQNAFGAISNLGDLRVRKSQFTENLGSLGTSAIVNTQSGTLFVTHTRFVTNFMLDGEGGAISNSGSATVRNSFFTGNLSRRGGAFSNKANARALIDNSEFVGNGAEFDGGAFWNAGTLTVRHISVGENAAGPSGFGGGLYLAAASETLLLNSVVNGNRALLGGGIYIAPGALPPTLIGTTVSGNFPDDIAPE